MHRTCAPLLLILSAVLLGGCSWLAVPTPTPSGGAGSQPGAGGGKPIGGGGGGLVVVPPIDGALREAPDPTIVDARPSAIDRYVIGPDGRTVVVYYWGGNQGCFGLHSVAVELRDGVPAITVNEGTRPAAVGTACTMEAVAKSAVVTLDAPILIDGSGAEPTAGEPQVPQQPQGVAPVAGVAEPSRARADRLSAWVGRRLSQRLLRRRDGQVLRPGRCQRRGRSGRRADRHDSRGEPAECWRLRRHRRGQGDAHHSRCATPARRVAELAAG
jgi:hypothetical protein